MLLTAQIYPGNIPAEIEEFSMNPGPDAAYIAFDGDDYIASGDLRSVAGAAKATLDRRKEASILVFDDATSSPIEIDFRGSRVDVLARLPEPAGLPLTAQDAAPSGPRGPGRPKLGVVAREVTLLPRHWEWLAQQSGGASVALRRLVDEARRSGNDRSGIREAQEATYRFMSAMAGNKPHYEEAIRALFAGEAARFEKWIAEWPNDIRQHTAKLAERVFHRDPRSPPVDPANVNR
jgi:uncharacterized protein